MQTLRPDISETVSAEICYVIRSGMQPTHYHMRAPGARLTRGEEVVCRTPRGIELGEVLTDEITVTRSPESDGRIETAKFIRRSRYEDRYLLDKLEELSSEANEACKRYLKEQDSPDVLLEVEPLLDGRTLYFHFLGEPTRETEEIIDRLAKEYQTSVAKSRFAEILEKGCGPGCGTKEKSGCGTSSGCAVCAIAGGCTKK